MYRQHTKTPNSSSITQHLRHLLSAKLSMTKSSRRGMAAPRGGGSAGRTPSAANTVLERARTTPPRRLNFGNHKNSQIRSTLSSQTGGPKHREPPVGVKGVVFSKHLMLLVPAYEQDGWIGNLSDSIAICKHYGLNGFKLAPGLPTELMN